MALAPDIASSTDPHKIDPDTPPVEAPGLQYFVFGLFFIFGGIALVGFFILFRILPETKGKTLEQLEADLVRT